MVIVETVAVEIVADLAVIVVDQVEIVAAEEIVEEVIAVETALTTKSHVATEA